MRMNRFGLRRPLLLLLVLGLVVPLPGCGGGGKSIWQEMQAGTPTPGTPGEKVTGTEDDDYAPSAAMFRGNPAHTGEYPGPGPKGKPTLLWRSQTGGHYPSPPVVAEGVLYVASNDGYLYALDAKSGGLLWRFKTGEHYAMSSPAVVSGVVYVATETTFFALDAASGEPMWRSELGCHCENEPVVADGIAYASGDVLYALNAATGEVVWRFERGLNPPAVAAGAVYVASGAFLYALDASTGATLWQATVGGTVSSSPSVAGGVLYACAGGGDGGVYALDAHTGDLRWQADTGCESELAVAGDVVYVGSGKEDQTYALDANNGSVIWQAEGHAWSAVVAGGAVYLARGSVYALEAATGDELWRFPLDDAVNDGDFPAVVDGVVYVTTEDEGYVYAIAGGQS